MGRRKEMRRVEGLTKSEYKSRVYGDVGRVDTMTDVNELIKAIESDNITEELKRQRLQFMYSLTSSESFKRQFRGSIIKARRAFERAYKRHLKGKA